MWQLRRPWQRWGRWSEPAGHWDAAAAAAVAAADGVDGDAHDSVCDACGDGAAAADDGAVAGDAGSPTETRSRLSSYRCHGAAVVAVLEVVASTLAAFAGEAGPAILSFGRCYLHLNWICRRSCCVVCGSV